MTTRRANTTRPAFAIMDAEVQSGQRRTIALPVADLYNHTTLNMPVQVVHGKHDGPVMFISAAIHGDEINGVEIIRRLLENPALKSLRGTILAIPIVNIQGFLSHSRYTSDRRDLNRSFPGSERGSVAGRLAHLFATEIVQRADYGIDLHTAAIHRDNLPQIRANLEDENTLEMATAFGAPVMLHSNLRDGSLREYATNRGTPMLLYEAGEALRFDEKSIRAGVMGVIQVMRAIGMLPARKRKSVVSVRANSSSWVRAETSGILRMSAGLGQRVKKGDALGVISDPFGVAPCTVEARYNGIIIGRSNLPLVNEGDALFHIARFDNTKSAENTVEQFTAITDDWELPEHGPPII